MRNEMIFASVEEALQRYPNINSVVSTGWTKVQASIDALDTDDTLSWWLRNFEHMDHILSVLDQVVGRLREAEVSGTVKRLKRIWQDPAGFRETLVELYFSAWLLDREYSFEFPNAGADVLVAIGPQSLPIEITALRRSTWFRLLLEKLDVIAAMAGFSGDMKYGREAPNRVSASAYRSILASIRKTMLNSDEIKESSMVQVFGDYDFTITWEKSSDAFFSASSSDLRPASQFGAKLVFSAAGKKAKQLPAGSPGCVLVDVSHDEQHHVHAFVSRLGGEAGLLQWKTIDPRIK